MQIEDAVAFCNARRQQLVGVWHQAGEKRETNGGAAQDTAVVMLHGWSGYRTGPHQMLTRAARLLADEGFSTLRFDFAGRGDSDGEAGEATLATMADDARAALSWCRRRGVKRFVLLGLCSGCEVAVAAAGEKDVAALALWSAPVFAAAQSGERQARKRAHHLKQYARKLLRPATYAKIAAGRLDTSSIRQAVGGGGGESRNTEADAAGQLPPGWRGASLQKFDSCRAPLLLLYGTGDPTTEEALAWHRARREGAGRDAPFVHLVAGANHSFYGLSWEREVFAATLNWLKRVTSAE